MKTALSLILAAIPAIHPVELRAQESLVLFSSNLDSDTGWRIVQEAVPSSQATFGFDYQALGIPPSPRGNGTTKGLRMAANANASIQAITACTTALFLTRYVVSFDFWGNTNGPLPAGGTGSTEFLGGGVGFTGDLPRSGAGMLVSIEGNSTVDWRLDKGAFAQAVTSGFYNPLISSLNVTGTTSDDPGFFFTAPFPGRLAPAAQSGTTGRPFNGTVAFGWHTMTILVNDVDGEASFWVDSTYIGRLTQAGAAVSTMGAGSLTLLDPFTSVSSADLNADPVFALFDNYRVEAFPRPGTSGFAVTSIHDGLILISLVMAPGFEYELKRSSDLQTWTPVQALGSTIGPATKTLLVPVPAAVATRQFYRVDRSPL